MPVIHQVYGYFMPTVNLMGAGAAQETGKQAKLLGGKKVLLVTDAYLEKIGMAKEIADIIEKEGMLHNTYMWLIKHTKFRAWRALM